VDVVISTTEGNTLWTTWVNAVCRDWAALAAAGGVEVPPDGELLPLQALRPMLPSGVHATTPQVRTRSTAVM
jgi:hypothetical protein